MQFSISSQGTGISQTLFFPSEGREEEKTLISINIFELSVKQKPGAVDRKDSASGKPRKLNWWQTFFSKSQKFANTPWILWNIKDILPFRDGRQYISVLNQQHLYLATPVITCGKKKRRNPLCCMFFLSLGKRKRERRKKKYPCAVASPHLFLWDLMGRRQVPNR